MAKTAQQIHDEERNILRSYYNAGDVKGLYLYLEENFQNIADGTDPDVEPRNQAWAEFLGDLFSNQNEKAHQFARDFWTFAGQRFGNAAIDAANEIDDVEIQIKNGELEGTELVATDPKLTKQLAVSVGRSKTEAGKTFQNIWDLNQFASVQLQTYGGTRKEELAAEYAELRDNAVSNQIERDPAWTAEKKKQYFDSLSSQIAKTIKLSSSQSKDFKRHHYTITLGDDNQKLFSEAPGFDDRIKAMDDAELAAFRKELVENSKAIRAYYAAGEEWRNRAAAFLKELEENASEEDKKTEAYKNLQEALNLNTIFGTSKPYKMPGDKHDRDAFCRPGVFADFKQKLKEAADAYPDKAFGSKVMGANEQAEKQLDKYYKAGAQKVIDHAASNKFTMPEKVLNDVKYIDAELGRRKILADKHNVEYSEAQKSVRSCVELQREVRQFRDEVRKSMYRCDNFAGNLKQDMSRRNISEKDMRKHPEYKAVIDSVNQLAGMDIDEKSPREILDSLKAAKQKADIYESTHAGLSNFTKGWSGEGRERIRIMRDISGTLDKQIQQLEPLVNTLEKKGVTGTIGERLSALETQKTSMRDKASAIRSEILLPDEKKIDRRIRGYKNDSISLAKQHQLDKDNEKVPEYQKTGTVMASAANVAAESLNTLMKLSEIKAPLTEEQKEQAVVAMGRTVGYDRPMFITSKDMDEQSYKEFMNKYINGEYFRPTLKETVGEITQESIRKFCADPSISVNVAEKSAAKVFEKIKIYVPPAKNQYLLRIAP